MRPLCFCPSAAHSQLKQSVLNGHLSFKATNVWSPGWPLKTDLTVSNCDMSVLLAILLAVDGLLLIVCAPVYYFCSSLTEVTDPYTLCLVSIFKTLLVKLAVIVLLILYDYWDIKAIVNSLFLRRLLLYLCFCYICYRCFTKLYTRVLLVH
jgi:hypothetical protein